MKNLLTLFVLAVFATGLFAQTNKNLTLLGSLPYADQLSSLWGYEAPDGTKYAIVGTSTKVSIVSLADPAAPVEVASVPGENTIWREVKTWGHHAFISIDNVATGNLIIDLQYLPDSVKWVTWKPQVVIGILPETVVAAHTVTMDEKGILWLNGTNAGVGQCLAFDVKNNPMAPEFLGAVGDYYVHDSYARGDTLWQANISDGFFSVYDVSNLANPVLLATQKTPNNFTHNVWPNDANTHVFTTDEVGDSYITSYDITDLQNITETDRWRQPFVKNSGIVPHNVHVKNDFIVTAHYTDGVVILDGSRPQNLVEVARFDSYPGPDAGGFSGCWGVYPYFSDDLIIASDMQYGLQILQPNYQRAAWLEGTATDLVSGLKLNGVRVELMKSGNLVASKNTNGQGNYATGVGAGGMHEVKFSKPGYYSQTVNLVLFPNQVTIHDVQLQSQPSFSVGGKVTEMGSGLLLGGAKVVIQNADFNFETTTDAGGNFTFSPFFQGDYQIYIGKWGWSTIGVNNETISQANSQFNFQLEKGYEDPFAIDLGWTTTGAPISGQFGLGDPVEVSVPIAGNPIIQPEDDIASDLGPNCYFTGNIADLNSGILIGAPVMLLSPSMDLTTYLNPKIVISTWYFALNQQTLQPTSKKMRVKLISGSTVKTILERSFTVNSPLEWQTDTLSVSQFLAPAANMVLRVEAGASGFEEVFEAGVDNFKVIESPLGSHENRLETAWISASPNPSATDFLLKMDGDKTTFDAANLLIFNVLGEKIGSMELENAAAEIRLGADWPAGVYFVQPVTEGKAAVPVRLVKQ